LIVSILIPTLGRPESLPPLIRSVRDTTPRDCYEIIFVVDHGDVPTYQVLRPYDVRVVVADGTYPQKINMGFDESVGDLILPTADDVRFHDDWYDEALALLSRRVMVVGTNDLSPAAEEGTTNVTMPIIRRSYVEGQGCVLNEPGVIFHEGYHHNFVETEVWMLATYRGVAKYAKRSIIEHLHPDWGKRDEDSTDAKGQHQNRLEDRDLYRERMAAWM
jgi:glycosyltransferase involved in cell wall biosynthesis